MDSRPKFHRADALKVAQELYDILKPYCEECKIVGSLRRAKPMVKDIEVLFVPMLGTIQSDLFTRTTIPLTDGVLLDEIKLGRISRRLNVNGSAMWGPENKLAVHVASGIPVDFFATTKDRWWNALVFRTGGKQSNINLCNQARSRGYKFEPYGRGFAGLRGQDYHQTTSERDVFEFVSMRYLEPIDRP